MKQRSCCTYSFRLPLDRRAAFRLLADPRHLDRLTPAWFRLEPLKPVSESLRVGSEISYRLGWRGLPLRWTSRITDWRPDEFFAYEQQQGPYRFFRHEHFFESIGGETEVRDHVVFTAPGGSLADRWVARPDLRRIFEYRAVRAPQLSRELQTDAEPERLPRRMPRRSASSSAIDRPT